MHPAVEGQPSVMDGTGSSGRRAPASDERGRLMRLGRARRPRRACLVAAVFAGSALFTTAAGPASAEVTECTSALPPGTYGHLVVPGGATCLLGAGGASIVVSGNVRVEPRGTLVAETARITGSIIGEDVNRIVVGRSRVGHNIVVIGGQPSGPPPPALTVCATIVEKNIVVQEVTGGIGIRTHLPTDPPAGLHERCGSVRNRIGGNLIVSHNTSFRALVLNNDVHRNMRFVDNTGPGPKEVKGNRVGRTLVCTGNDEPFTASGNTAARGPERCNTA